MKTISKSKIDWCDYVWNFVVGCNTGCPYCYAKKYMKRFWRAFYTIEVKRLKEQIITGFNEEPIKENLECFKPQFLVNKFEREFPKKSSIIFINPFSDIKWWDKLWVDMMISEIKKHKHHTFVLLTKYPKVYFDYEFPENCILGITITKDEDINNDFLTFLEEYETNNKIMLSVEPIHGEIDCCLLDCFDWVIIGAETGNRKNKVVPNIEWVEKIVTYCQDNVVPVFLKENIQHIWDDDIIQEYPDE